MSKQSLSPPGPDSNAFFALSWGLITLFNALIPLPLLVLVGALGAFASGYIAITKGHTTVKCFGIIGVGLAILSIVITIAFSFMGIGLLMFA